MAKKDAIDPKSSEEAPVTGDAPAKDKEGKGKKPPKNKEGKSKEARTAPVGPPPDAQAAPTPEGPGPVAAPPTPVAEGSSKKKGQRPGISPRPGKKHKERLNNLRQRIAKAEPASVKSAIGLLKQMKLAKFDETVEVHMSLGLDASQSDQAIRGTVSLPHGIGKTVRVVVFCQGENVAKAKEAGADFAGSDDLIEKIQKSNWLDFDVALATQDMMGKVSRLGKVLGPRGLMPTPKAGTVTTGDVAQAVREFKAGKVEFRSDKGGNVHAGVGKLSFDEEKLAANIAAFVDQIKVVKPSGIKGNYIKSVTLCSTMSPGITVVV